MLEALRGYLHLILALVGTISRKFTGTGFYSSELCSYLIIPQTLLSKWPYINAL